MFLTGLVRLLARGCTDMGKITRKRETFVPGKRPSESRRACQSSEGGKNQGRGQGADDGCRSSSRPSRSEEYLNNGISCGTLQSNCYIANAEQYRDGEGHREGATDK